MSHFRKTCILSVSLALPLAASTFAFADSSCDSAYGNLITNCGFENGTTGWTLNDNTNYTAAAPIEPNSGNNALYIGAGAQGAGNPPASISQTFSDVAGHTYNLSFFLQNENTGGVTYPGVDFFGASVQDVNGVTTNLMPDQSIPSYTPDQYTQFTFAFTGSGTDTLIFDFENDPSYYNLDDVTVTEPAPEPSSLALMGTGAMVFAEITRRRVNKAADLA